MATTIDELVVKIQADVEDLKKGMAEGQAATLEALKAMEGGTKGFSEKSGQHMLNFSHIAETALGVFEGEAILHGLETLAEKAKELFEELIVEGVKAAAEDEAAFSRLNFILQASGRYTEEASRAMMEFAESSEHTTRFTSQQVLSASALLEAMTGLDEKGLKRASKGAQDLATVLHIDLETAAQMMGRAFEGNVTIFQRHGIQIQKGATDAQTYANALKFVEQYSGAAESALNTFAGQQAHLHNEWEALTKEVGKSITSNQAVMDIMKELGEAVGHAAKYISDNRDEIKEWVADGILTAIASLEGLVQVLEVLYRVGVVAVEPLLVSFKMFTASVQASSLALHGDFKGALDASLGPMKAMAQDLSNLKDAVTGNDKTFAGLNATLEKFSSTAARGLAEVKTHTHEMSEQFDEATGAVKRLTSEQIKLGEEGAKLAKQALENDPKTKYDMDLAALNAAHSQQLISDEKFQAAVAQVEDAYRQSKKQKEQEEFDEHLKRLNALRKSHDSANAAQIKSEEATLHRIINSEKANSTERILNQQKLQQAEEQINQERTAAAMGALGQLASFQNSKNKEMAAVGKAAAISETVISTYTGASKAGAALAGIPIVGPALAAAAIAAYIAGGLARVATISGVELASGMDSVPGIGTADNFPAVLAPGERVVPSDTNKDLKDFLSKFKESQSQSGGGHHVIELSLKGDLVKIVEAKIVKSQRLNTSILKRIT